jgi:hypothetical protein
VLSPIDRSAAAFVLSRQKVTRIVAIQQEVLGNAKRPNQ